MSDILTQYRQVPQIVPSETNGSAVLELNGEALHLVKGDSKDELSPTVWRLPTKSESLATSHLRKVKELDNFGYLPATIELWRTEEDFTNAISKLISAILQGDVIVAPYLSRFLFPQATVTTISPTLGVLPVASPTLPPATHTNTYFIRDGRQAYIVDPAGETELLARAIATWKPALTGVFLTHHHGDHIAAAKELAERFSVPVLAHNETASRVGIQCITPGDYLTDNIQLIFTPGHAPGHLCLFHTQERWLIAGDMVAGVGTILVEPNDGDMTLYLQSLREMQALQASLILPAHGPYSTDAEGLLSHYITHRLKREEKVENALSDVPQSLEVLVAKVYDDAPVFLHPIAKLSLHAHLIKLKREHRCVENQTGEWRL